MLNVGGGCPGLWLNLAKSAIGGTQKSRRAVVILLDRSLLIPSGFSSVYRTLFSVSVNYADTGKFELFIRQTQDPVSLHRWEAISWIKGTSLFNTIAVKDHNPLPSKPSKEIQFVTS